MRLKFLSLLAGIQALLGILFYFLLPADPKNSAFLGFSFFRLSLIAFLLVISLVCLWFYFGYIAGWEEKTIRFLTNSSLP